MGENMIYRICLPKLGRQEKTHSYTGFQLYMVLVLILAFTYKCVNTRLWDNV